MAINIINSSSTTTKKSTSSTSAASPSVYSSSSGSYSFLISTIILVIVVALTSFSPQSVLAGTIIQSSPTGGPQSPPTGGPQNPQTGGPPTQNGQGPAQAPQTASGYQQNRSNIPPQNQRYPNNIDPLIHVPNVQEYMNKLVTMELDVRANLDYAMLIRSKVGTFQKTERPGRSDSTKHRSQRGTPYLGSNLESELKSYRVSGRTFVGSDIYALPVNEGGVATGKTGKPKKEKKKDKKNDATPPPTTTDEVEVPPPTDATTGSQQQPTDATTGSQQPAVEGGGGVAPTDARAEVALTEEKKKELIREYPYINGAIPSDVLNALSHVKESDKFKVDQGKFIGDLAGVKADFEVAVGEKQLAALNEVRNMNYSPDSLGKVLVPAFIDIWIAQREILKLDLVFQAVEAGTGDKDGSTKHFEQNLGIPKLGERLTTLRKADGGLANKADEKMYATKKLIDEMGDQISLYSSSIGREFAEPNNDLYDKLIKHDNILPTEGHGSEAEDKVRSAVEEATVEKGGIGHFSTLFSNSSLFRDEVLAGCEATIADLEANNGQGKAKGARLALGHHAVFEANPALKEFYDNSRVQQTERATKFIADRKVETTEVATESLRVYLEKIKPKAALTNNQSQRPPALFPKTQGQQQQGQQQQQAQQPPASSGQGNAAVESKTAALPPPTASTTTTVDPKSGDSTITATAPDGSTTTATTGSDATTDASATVKLPEGGDGKDATASSSTPGTEGGAPDKKIPVPDEAKVAEPENPEENVAADAKEVQKQETEKPFYKRPAVVIPAVIGVTAFIAIGATVGGLLWAKQNSNNKKKKNLAAAADLKSKKKAVVAPLAIAKDESTASTTADDVKNTKKEEQNDTKKDKQAEGKKESEPKSSSTDDNKGNSADGVSNSEDDEADDGKDESELIEEPLD